MNAFQKCINTADVVPLYLPQQLYLKPIARIKISIQLTQKIMGKTITHYELIKKLQELIAPDEFTILKVIKTTIEIIRFEGEVEHRNNLVRVISKLDNKMIKLKDFNELMRVRAGECRGNFPTKHVWDTFFRDAKDMNEMKPGERPDTVHISNLPTKWFVPYRLQTKESLLPSEKIFYHVFEKFGSIRNVDIPVCDPYRSKMKAHISGVQTSSFEEAEFFEGYIQFKDYIGFSKCMDALRGMKLLHKDKGEAVTINIFVDFDKSKHLSEASIRRRDIVRDRLILKQKNKEDKEQEELEQIKLKEQADKQLQLDILNEKDRRRTEREEKRKAKILAQLKRKGTDDISDKIAREEKKLLRVQRQLEAIRLVEELFKRIKSKSVKGIDKTVGNNDKLLKMKSFSEVEVKTQRDKLHNAIEGRVILKSIIAGQAKTESDSSSESADEPIKNIQEHVYPAISDMNWYGMQHVPTHMPSYNSVPTFYNQTRFPYYMPRGRGISTNAARFPFNKRPFNRWRGRGIMNHYLQQEYYKYAQNLFNGGPQFGRHMSRSFSRSRSRSPSRHGRSRSGSRHGKSRSSSRHGRSHSASRHNRSRSLSRYRGRSYSRTKSRSYSRSRSRSKVRSKSRSRRSRSRRSSTRETKSRSPKSRSKSKSRK